jgi:hypothetical protein
MDTIKNESFEKRMEAWATQQAEESPQLEPTPEMIRLVEVKRRERPQPFPLPRWSHVAVALSAAVIILTTYISLYKPDLLFKTSPEAFTYVARRQVSISEVRHNTLEGVPPDQGKGRGPEIYQQLDMQVHRGAENRIDSLDLRYQLDQPLTLTPKDSYRILLKAKKERVLYLFLRSPSGEFQALINPFSLQVLPAKEKIFLPTKPDWFYLLGEPGEYQLYLVSIPERESELERLYLQHTTSRKPEQVAIAASALQSYLSTIGYSPETAIWQLSFTFEAGG